MKKLSKIDHIEFKKGFVLINHIQLNISENIFEWLESNCEIQFSVENYIEKFPKSKKISFLKTNGIRIYLDEEEIESINVNSYLPNDSRNRFEGKIIVFGKVLPKPFLSDDIEKFFPKIKIENPPGGYWERFKAWELVDYPINESSKIEISMNRNPKYVGALSLRKA